MAFEKDGRFNLLPTMKAIKELPFSYNTLMKYVAEGCPCYRLGSQRYFDLDEVEAWVRGH